MGWRHKAPPEVLRARFNPRRRPRACITGKRAWTSKRKAMQILTACRTEGRLERSAYKCPHCHQWHLTKQRRKRT